VFHGIAVPGIYCAAGMLAEDGHQIANLPFLILTRLTHILVSSLSIPGFSPESPQL